MKKLIITCILFITAFSSLPTYSSANTATNSTKILQHNVFLLPSYITRWGQSERAKLIGEADYMKGQDAIILNELFDNSASSTLLEKLKDEYPHQTSILGRSKDGWDQTLGDYSNFVPEDGGVAIISKWPIEEKIQYVYESACGSDKFANKGFVYIKMNQSGEYKHIIGTHAQADDTGCGEGEDATVRHNQFKEIAKFIESKQIPEDEMLIIGGDFNVIKDNTEEYDSMLKTLNVTEPKYTGHTSTWDPETNAIAEYDYPDFAPQHLDYIFVSSGHKHPSTWINEVLNIKSPPWTAVFNEYNEYSDHYPIAAYSN
ncbi:sphingomyelin phosphodiesterase [Bacillus carboniphilus]|uniref:Sphingomyelin phosphodiesterase n=1 Tax=Bacillus carboniphilus TaxID=86663 RepID=A0ABY9JQ49_9BACI|nr:sphingomyelin phosphodiesterase [Bacillus carboniphilus]WLR41526.1 sphingomyelin phosphodiesterase [Bacillus carboniphilus]